MTNTPLSTTDRWASELTKAAACKAIAETDFFAMVAETAHTIPQREIASVLHTSQAQVSRWAARGREHAERRDGRPGADPYEIAQRYALGQITREQMIAALSQWPYEPDHVPQDYWDDTGVLQEGGFEDTVGRALSDGLLSDEDYDEILDALPS